MSVTATILHDAVAGRIRVHLPDWSGQGKAGLERQLRRARGVEKVQANALTGNVLTWFNPNEISEQRLLEVIAGLHLATTGVPDEEPALPSALRERQGKKVRARITVRGLDRDPRLARHVVEHLERFPGVSVRINQLTGRVLVEFTEHKAELDDLISTIAGLELPNLPGEDHPSHPLDPGPLLQGSMRIIGATLGLGVLCVRRLLGSELAFPGAGAATRIVSIINIIQSIPPIRYGLRRHLGRTVADLVVNVPTILTLTIAGSPLGLILVGVESLRLLTEVQARRRMWRRHEEDVARAPSAQPGAVIHLEAGERTPLPGSIIEGVGTAIGRDGMPLAVTQGTIVPPGARLYGGPFVLTLQAEEAFEAFTPQSRPAPVKPSLYTRYIQVVGPVSLLYAVGAGILTRSFTQALTSLLLVNPRTAAIGVDGADPGAAARVLRAGVTIVGTRKDRPIRLPHVIMLDGARPLTDALEVFSVQPFTQAMDMADMLAIMAGISAAAGSPWGSIFSATGAIAATDGSFDGHKASALIEGVRYTLDSAQDGGMYPQTAQLRQHGSYVLMLSCEHRASPLGLLALRPRLAQGVAELVRSCQRHHVALHVLATSDQIAVQALARRAAIPPLACDNALDAIRAKQQEGLLVAFVSDNAGANAAFAACDLAIGLAEHRYRLPARADVLAPDLAAVAAIVEAGERRERTIRDSVGLSVFANIFGLLWGLGGMPGLEQALRAVYITALGALADGWLRLRGGTYPSRGDNLLF